MNVDLRNIAILQLGLGLNAGASVDAKVRARPGACMTRQTRLFRCSKNVDYERRLGPILAGHRAVVDGSFFTSHSKVGGSSLPYDQL